ncbi:hypothetical protein OAF63_02405 [Saprospiraceae bacterium]|nr:hypothetical protein [Saprospiraceae bacterium]
MDNNKRINCRKRHLITDTLGLLWGVIVHADNLHDETTAHKVVGPYIGYLHRLKKILGDTVYEKIFRDWVYENMLRAEQSKQYLISINIPCLQSNL